MDEKKSNGKYVVIAVVAFLVGFGSAWLWLTKSPAGVAIVGDKTSGKVENKTGLEITGNSIVVGDQVAGISASIDSVKVEKTSWVAIHEDNNGAPGNILGAQLFEAGEHSGSVELLRGMLPAKTYYAMIHTEDGDRAFDPKKDLPLIDDVGQPVWAIFNTLAE
ncbi:MAG: hypothetical protein WC250_03635 [Candidatus Paceibacterota bacterium]|jgi:hypothetical protein